MQKKKIKVLSGFDIFGLGVSLYMIAVCAGGAYWWGTSPGLQRHFGGDGQKFFFELVVVSGVAIGLLVLGVRGIVRRVRRDE